jgi:hypothetical protein
MYKNDEIGVPKMKKTPARLCGGIFFVLAIFVIAPAVFGQVNQEELGNLGPVEFINYEGPYTRIETRAQIRAIGYSVGVMVRNGQNSAGGSGRYFVIHSVSAADGPKLDADIFGLGVDVGVDHIRNLRVIVQGYLEAAYEYSERDAALLAEYITIYNAVYRGDIKYFESRYKKAVMDNVTQEKAGLSIRYDEWPGRTLIVIPLGAVSTPLNSIDTTSISDSRVTEQLRQEPDRSVDSRKDMVELKERQSGEAEQQAAVQREAIQEEEARVAEQRQQAAQERQQAVQERQQAVQEQQQIAEERQQPGADQQALDQRQQEAEQREQAAEQKEQAAEQKQQEAEQKQQELEQQKEEAEQTQQYAEQKAEEAQQDRQGIAQDQQVLINQETAPPPPDGVLGASIITPTASLGRVVKVNPDNGQEVKRSVLNTVNARSVTLVDGRIIAIAGENRGNGAIRLVEIAADTLEMAKQGDDDIAPNSLLWADGGDLYAITTSGGNLYLTRFNTDLVRQARSSVTVHPFAAVTFAGGFVATQRADGTAVLLNSQDLTEKR